MSTMAVPTWIVMVTKKIINTRVVLGTNQITTIIIMLVISWEVLGFKQIIKITTSITMWVMHSIVFAIVVIWATLVKIVTTYHELQRTTAVAVMNHTYNNFSLPGFQCTAATSQVICPPDNLSYSELYLMVSLFKWNIKKITVPQRYRIIFVLVNIYLLILFYFLFYTLQQWAMTSS